MKIRVTFILIIMLCMVSFSRADDRYRIRIGSRSLQPERGFMVAGAPAGRFFIMQFHRLPDEGARAALSASGLEFHRYVGGNAWLVRRSGSADPAAMEASLVRATVPYDELMKRSPLFAADRLLRSALDRGERVRAQVRFFPGVSREQALDLTARKGIPVRAAHFGYGRSLVIECSATELDDLLREETVELVDPGLPESKEFNIDAASRTGADDVRRRAPFRSADGASSRVGVWDGGPIKSHTDFQDRVTIIENTSASNHATHVAGSVAGAGLLNGNALGMAPAARLWSWDFNGDVVSEKAAGIAAYGLNITTNSWGSVSGWDSDTNDDDSTYWRWVGDWMFATYHDSAASLDALIRERDVLIVFAAGNDRGEHYLGPHYHNFDKTITYNDTHIADPQYRSIPTWGNAKNNLTVGATHKDDVITSFSCWGPTSDGRLKPDVVAPGFGLLSTYADNGYTKASGTSMATPVVSGLAALLADYHQRRHGTAISGLALKTLLIHSARDLGVAGPDFIYGHGMVDGELAARVVRTAVFKAANFGVQPKPKVDRDADMSSMIIEDSVGQGGFKVYKITVPEGRAELRATLVWFDPAGGNLINNLDLSLKRKGQPLARPFVANPANPASAAVTGINNRDPVESVMLKKAPGGVWRVYVRGASVPQGPQRFCLIVSAGDGNEPPALLKNNTFTLMKVHPSSDSNWDAINEKTVFSTGDDLWFYTYITVSDNAIYDGWYGTLLETWRVINAAGETVFETYYSHDGFYPRPNYWRWRLGPYDVPSGMARGNYTLEVAVTSFTGETQTASCTFTVQ